MNPRRDGCELKILRAEEHLNALEKEIQAFFKAEGRVVVAIQTDRRTGDRVWRVEKPPAPPPERWGVIVGDVLHNLRSALDHLAWRLVLANGGRPDSRIEFPIFRDEDRFRAEAGAKMRGASSEARDMIEASQPWRIPRPEVHWLWRLHQLSITDKHRELHLAVVAVHGGFFAPGLPFAPNLPPSRPIAQDMELFRLPAEHGDVTYDPYFGVELVGEDTITGKILPHSLRLIHGGASALIARFRSRFL